MSGQFYRLDFIGGKGGPKPLFSETPNIPLCTLNFLYVYDTVLQLYVSTKLRIYVDLAHAQERKVTLMRCGHLVTNLPAYIDIFLLLKE